MALEVIGAGFGRTGTLSLKGALERLGFGPCYHMVEVFRSHPEHVAQWRSAQRGQAVDWDSLFAAYRATVDWPSCNHWKELAERYPRAKVVLTRRDPVGWYESVSRTIYPSARRLKASEDPTMREMGAWIDEAIWQGVFGGAFEDRDHALRVYARHVASVVAGVAPERLLIMDGRHDWEDLCAFLRRPIPDQPYPTANSTAEFLTRGGAGRRSPGRTEAKARIHEEDT